MATRAPHRIPGESSVDRDSVFLNVPFDSRYEALFVSLIASVVAVGRKPRCVLELPASAGRLIRIFQLLKTSAVSIHDLSRVSATRTPHGSVPRFNMPFELGLACALTLTAASPHQFFVFEERQFRLQTSLSDLNGYDPQIHGGTHRGMVAAVLNVLGRADGRDPSPAIVAQMARDLRRAVLLLKSQDGARTIFTRTHFQRTVSLAVALAESQNLLRP